MMKKLLSKDEAMKLFRKHAFYIYGDDVIKASTAARILGKKAVMDSIQHNKPDWRTFNECYLDKDHHVLYLTEVGLGVQCGPIISLCCLRNKGNREGKT